MEVNIILHGDALEKLKTLPDKSVHCCVTSPPYYNLRDYKTPGQIGLEDTPEEFIEKLVLVFREVRRVLRDDGTIWVNMGDSYASKGKNRTKEMATRKSGLKYGLLTQEQSLVQKSKVVGDYKAKDLMGIPWMLAFALRNDGWYLRQDIIWHKPNPLPESVTDRCSKSHEYIFLLSKSPRYYYDNIAIMQPIAQTSISRLSQDIENQNGSGRIPGKTNGTMKASYNGSVFNTGKTGEVMEEYRNGVRKSGNKQRKNGSERGCPEDNASNVCASVPWEGMKANRRSVWTIATKPFAESHFATFPEDLICDPIKAGSCEYGVCNHCGSPYRRLYKQNLVPTDKASFRTKPDQRDMNADVNDASSNRVKDGHKPGHAYETHHLGWVPTCKCYNIEKVPAIILDPFFGAGTTGIVARKLGRNFIGIELNESYINDIAIPRLKRELGLFY